MCIDGGGKSVRRAAESGTRRRSVPTYGKWSTGELWGRRSTAGISSRLGCNTGNPRVTGCDTVPGPVDNRTRNGCKHTPYPLTRGDLQYPAVVHGNRGLKQNRGFIALTRCYIQWWTTKKDSDRTKTTAALRKDDDMTKNVTKNRDVSKKTATQRGSSNKILEGTSTNTY